MKIKHFFIALATVAVLFTACKRDECDYRDKWIGDWEFVVERSWQVGWDTGHDTIYYLGKVTLVNTDSLLIEYTNYTNIIMHVNESGKLSKYYDMYYYARGQFEGNDKIQLETGYHGAPGGGDNKIAGTKKKGVKHE